MAAALTACSSHDDIYDTQNTADARELQGIEAFIVGSHDDATRAGTVTTLADYVGRDVFVTDDRIVFTKICRTTTPLEKFTYPNSTDSYNGIIYQSGASGAWTRQTSDGGPERVYWTDAENPHTFIGYGTPQTYYGSTVFDWKRFTFTPSGGSELKCYIGSLGDPTLTGEGNDTIDYTLSTTEQTTYSTTVDEVTTYSNPKLENEDLLLTHSTSKVAETGGSVALIDFYHALSSVRVVVNISGFSSSSDAADNATVVSNMRLLDQPTMYLWMQAGAGAQELRNLDPSLGKTAQEMIDLAWAGTSPIPAYDQKKTLKLWIPQPAGFGSGQSKTFTFYGITTPQDAATTDSITLQFDVSYPNPMKPSKTQTRIYTAKLGGVDFRAGYNTTINISLNHRNEQMTVGAQYENWQFVATPDAGQLKKNSTFLASTSRDSVTIVGDTKATEDDATWLYKQNNVVYDIYGNDGSETYPYKICTAYQLLSFAYEVKNNHDFTDKFIRLDADITLQTSSTKTLEEMKKLETSEEELAKYSEALDWIGIGDDTHAFNGTFIGGDRFIYRLNGTPFFYNIGSSAKIKHLQMTVIDVDGSGAIANSNAGLICGAYIAGDVTLNGTSGGAFVGTNTGNIFCSYHIGDTESNNTDGGVSLGGLVGTNESGGEIANCYHAGRIIYSSTITPSSTAITTGGITCTNNATEDKVVNNYYNSTLLTPSNTIAGITGKTSAEMTKPAFVTTFNSGIDTWHGTHGDYDWHQYQYNPANYPTLSTTLKTE